MASEWEQNHEAGLLALQEGHYAKAESLLRAAIASVRDNPGEELKLAASLHHLGRVYRALERFPEAEALYQQALELREDVLGPDDPEVARTLQNMAVLNALRERFDLSEPLIQRAIAILERALGDDHPEVATARRNQERMTQARSGDAPSLPASGHDILIVEDDPATRYSLSRMLQGEGYTAATAANGRKALEYLHRNPPPRLILMDMLMPDMNGWEFRVQLSQERGVDKIPVVILSGIANVERHADLLQADGYLTKPVDREKLLRVVGTFFM